MRDQGTARLVAQGDAATAAGLAPKAGDVVRFDDHAPWWPGVEVKVVHVGDAGLQGEHGAWLGTREQWADVCEAHGYLIERGGVSNG